MNHKSMALSKRSRDLLGAGGAYLLALGGGVLISPVIAVGFVVLGSLLLTVVGASTDAAQRVIPPLGRLPLIEDQRFKVISGAELDDWRSALLDAEAAEIEAREPEPHNPESVTFHDIKPRVEAFLEEARAMWMELASDPPPERVGALYDAALAWQRRAVAELTGYQWALARELELGGKTRYGAPQLEDLHPTDRDALQLAVERRGHVLRNLLDGTPGKDLGTGPTSIFDF